MKYYKTTKSTGTTGYWEVCASTTLLGAKREATRDCGGYEGDVICVGMDEYNRGDSPIHTIAERRCHHGKWRDCR